MLHTVLVQMWHGLNVFNLKWAVPFEIHTPSEEDLEFQLKLMFSSKLFQIQIIFSFNSKFHIQTKSMRKFDEEILWIE